MAKKARYWGCKGERALQNLSLTASYFRTESPPPPLTPSNSPPVFSWEGLNRILLWEP